MRQEGQDNRDSDLHQSIRLAAVQRGLRRRKPRHWRIHLALLVAVCWVGTSAESALGRDAYIANEESDSVSVINTQTNEVVGSPIEVGTFPDGIAITPDGSSAYVINYDSKDVSVIDTQTNEVVGSPIEVGTEPDGIAITPDGKTVYVINYGSKDVSVIDTQTNEVVGSPIEVGTKPVGIAITPDGQSAYVVNSVSGTLSVIDTQTNQVLGSPIGVGKMPYGIAITPNGKAAYVTNGGSMSKDVSVINTQTNQVEGPPIGVGEIPKGIAITPDGKIAYVANDGSGTVSVINTQTNQVKGPPIGVGTEPVGIAITPDGKSAYVANLGSKDVSVINTQTNQVVGMPIGVGAEPTGIASIPDQSPVASFTVFSAYPGLPTDFNASDSSDPYGPIATYAWEFGDGTTLSTTTPSIYHSFSALGSYQARLTVTDDEGCSTELIFTGQTAYCNGSEMATQTKTVIVQTPLTHTGRQVSPKVLVRCPIGAKPGGCTFKLKAVTKRRKGKTESAVASARLRAGYSTAVRLVPKPAYRVMLDSAKRLLVKETVLIKGSARTVIRRLVNVH